MTRFHLVAIAAGLWLSAGASRAQQASPPPFDEMYRLPLVYSVPGMDKVEVRREIVFKQVQIKEQAFPLKLDAYLPSDGKTHPAVVLISGGGVEGSPFDFRDAGVYQSYGRVLGASGFVAISYSKRYERGPRGSANGAEDTRDLIAYLREHAAELHIDADRMAFWSFSAGGLMLAPLIHDTPAAARALLCFYCVSDVTLKTWTGLAGVTDEQRAVAVNTLSAANQIRNSEHAVPPLFIARAGLDSAELNAGIERLVQAALARNLAVELMNHPQGRHAFDILDDNEKSREIIKRAIAFLQTNLSGKP